MTKSQKLSVEIGDQEEKSVFSDMCTFQIPAQGVTLDTLFCITQVESN